MHVHVFQHVVFEGLGQLADWARARTHRVTATRLFAGETPPPVPDYNLLVVMGGPMGANDERDYPWLTAEKRAIAQALAAGRRVVGVCLGAQLIAAVLGARVYPNAQKEIGWFPIEMTAAAQQSWLFADFPPRLDVFHWHGDTFDLPAGAQHIASSAACRHQAFVAAEGRAVALQFHLEMGPPEVAAIIANCGDELEAAVGAPWVQPAEEMQAHAVAACATVNALAAALFDRLSN